MYCIIHTFVLLNLHIKLHITITCRRLHDLYLFGNMLVFIIAKNMFYNTFLIYNQINKKINKRYEKRSNAG